VERIPFVECKEWRFDDGRLAHVTGRLIAGGQVAESDIAESHLTSRLSGQILRRIERLTWHPT
jgi:hypothetical protein